MSKLYKLSDDTTYLLELFQAKPVRTSEYLANMFGSYLYFYRRIMTLRKHGHVIERTGYGEWKYRGDV
jgi:hypothetical protein